MTDRELAGVRGELEVFAAQMFKSFSRRDQRKWGGVYLRGLMLDGKRKSVQPMAERLWDGNEQALQQFISQSSWDWGPVRERLAKKMSEVLGADAYVIDDTGFPKHGRFSVGVARQYSGTLGKIGNCQIGVSLHLASDLASAPINWRLFIPEEWDSDEVRRAKAHVPAHVSHCPKWEQALQMLDQTVQWGLDKQLPVIADAGYGEITEFRRELQQRGFSYVVGVQGKLSCYPSNQKPVVPTASGGRGRRPYALRYNTPPSNLKETAFRLGQNKTKIFSWRPGSKPNTTLRSEFLITRVAPANIKLRRQATEQNKALEEVWLICQWPKNEKEPTHYWLSNLPANTPHSELVRLAKLRWRIEHDYRELKDGLGLDHFEGRSYTGWHHHTTLASIAHGFLTHQRLNPKKTLQTQHQPYTASSKNYND